MKVYKVTGGMLALGAGSSVLLLAATAAARAHNLEPYKPGKSPAVQVVTRQSIELKAGELVGLETVPKSHADRLEEVKDGRKGSGEYALLVAAEEIEEAAVAAERDRARQLQEGERQRLLAEKADREKAWTEEWKAGSEELHAKFSKVEDYLAAKAKEFGGGKLI